MEKGKRKNGFLPRSLLNAKKILSEKWKESISSVVPIVGLVTLLCFLLVPMPSDALAGFVFGTLLLLIGMGMFNLGADMAIPPSAKPLALA